MSRLKKIVKVKSDVDDYPPLEHDGIVYDRGDDIYISGERGVFSLRFWDTTSEGKKTVTVWQDRQGCRSFYVDRIKSSGSKRESSGSMGFVCAEHKSYKALRRPRTPCETCRDAFEYRQARKENSGSNLKNQTKKKIVKKKKSTPVGKIDGFILERVEE